MKTVLNTLYVFTRGAYLKRDADTVVAIVEGEKRMQVPLHHLSGFALFGEVTISPALIHSCGEEGRMIALFSHHGEFKGRFEGAVNGNVLLRVAQFRKSESGEHSLALAKSFVSGKIKNSRQVILRTGRDTLEKDEVEQLKGIADRLAGLLRKVGAAESLDQVRGFEGEAARSYFEAMPLHIRYDQRPSFPFNGRTKRPPRDRMNALLSFLYALVQSDCAAAVEGVGLDPQIGFLHALRPGRASLGLDLCEEFRPFLADRLAFTLINRLQIRPEDFEDRNGGAVYLNEDGRKKVVQAYQARKQEQVTHEFLKEPLPIGLLPHIQARLLARVIRGDAPTYTPFLYR